MTEQESQQALQQLQALYSMTRRVLTTADEHEGAKATAQALASVLRPPAPPMPVPGPAPAAPVPEVSAAGEEAKGSAGKAQPVATRRGKIEAVS